jgi:hypothetical protein
MVCWIFVLVPKTVMPKKKVFDARNLKDCLPSLPLNRRKAKKKIKVFNRDIFYASLSCGEKLFKVVGKNFLVFFPPKSSPVS